MVKFFKQLFCNHEWKWYERPPKGPFRSLNGIVVVQACPKCEKIKKSSEYLRRYEGNGYK